MRSGRRGPEAHVLAELLEFRQFGGIALQPAGEKPVAQRVHVDLTQTRRTVPPPSSAIQDRHR